MGKKQLITKGTKTLEGAVEFVEDVAKGRDMIGKNETAAAKADLIFQRRLKNPLYSDTRAQINYLDDVQEVRDNVEKGIRNEALAKKVKIGAGIAGLGYIGNEILKSNHAQEPGGAVAPSRQYRNRVKTAAVQVDMVSKAIPIMDRLIGKAKKAGELMSGKAVEKAEKIVAGRKEALTAAEKGLAKGQARNSTELANAKAKAEKADALLAKTQKAQTTARITAGAIGGTGVAGGVYFGTRD